MKVIIISEDTLNQFLSKHEKQVTVQTLLTFLFSEHSVNTHFRVVEIQRQMKEKLL